MHIHGPRGQGAKGHVSVSHLEPGCQRISPRFLQDTFWESLGRVSKPRLQGSASTAHPYGPEKPSSLGFYGQTLFKQTHSSDFQHSRRNNRTTAWLRKTHKTTPELTSPDPSLPVSAISYRRCLEAALSPQHAPCLCPGTDTAAVGAVGSCRASTATQSLSLLPALQPPGNAA